MGSAFKMQLRGLAAGAALAAATAFAAPAGAVTITDGKQFDQGMALDLSGLSTCGTSGAFSTNVGKFSGSGPAGSGGASCGDKTAVQVKNGSTPFPFGRYNPKGGAWIDSNDLASVTWELNSAKAVKGISFALVDAHDQANSNFSITVDGVSWGIANREENGKLHLISILFDAPVNTATITFDTRLNDGYGVSDVRVAPVPLPPALALMGSGFLLLGAMRLRRSRAA